MTGGATPIPPATGTTGDGTLEFQFGTGRTCATGWHISRRMNGSVSSICPIAGGSYNVSFTARGRDRLTGKPNVPPKDITVTINAGQPTLVIIRYV